MSPERSAGRGGALWGGRFESGMAPEMEALNRSLDADFRLWREDVRGSRAWAGALLGAGVIDDEEHRALTEGLTRVAERLEAGVPEGATDEDVHTLVERLLTEEAGAVAGKLHTGRSRNDQVATDLRLWGMAAAAALEEQLAPLAGALIDLAEREIDVILPGYTHLQQGQPIRAGHWALSHAWAILRDIGRVRRARRQAAVLPLGSGAIAGCPFPVNREALREELGFRALSENSVDAVGDRDWSAELIFAGALIGIHLSRLGEDLVIFSSHEFSFIEIGEGYTTGSSLMPQKRNPDVAELARAKVGRLVGNLTGVLTLLKGLPAGYNRDLQDEKLLLFDTVDALALVLPALTGAVPSLRFRGDRIAERLSSELLATDLADALVRSGVPFRESHEIVGGWVREAEKRGVSLADLPAGVTGRWGGAVSGPALEEIFDWERSVEARAVEGGTSRGSVLSQIRHARSRLLAARI